MATRTLTLILGIVTTAVTLILTPALHVDAANESSYHYGFRAGFGKYQCLSESTRYLYGTCDDLPHYDDVNTDCVSLAHRSYGQVTNSTACMDGFSDGWMHWCGLHAIQCNTVAKPDYIKPSH